MSCSAPSANAFAKLQLQHEKIQACHVRSTSSAVKLSKLLLFFYSLSFFVLRFAKKRCKHQGVGNVVRSHTLVSTKNKKYHLRHPQYLQVMRMPPALSMPSRSPARHNNKKINQTQLFRFGVYAFLSTHRRVMQIPPETLKSLRCPAPHTKKERVQYLQWYHTLACGCGG